VFNFPSQAQPRMSAESDDDYIDIEDDDYIDDDDDDDDDIDVDDMANLDESIDCSNVLLADHLSPTVRHLEGPTAGASVRVTPTNSPTKCSTKSEKNCATNSPTNCATNSPTNCATNSSTNCATNLSTNCSTSAQGDPAEAIFCHLCDARFRVAHELHEHANYEHCDAVSRTWHLCSKCLWFYPSKRSLRCHECDEKKIFDSDEVTAMSSWDRCYDLGNFSPKNWQKIGKNGVFDSKTNLNYAKI
jgi:hypothetical protein